MMFTVYFTRRPTRAEEEAGKGEELVFGQLPWWQPVLKQPSQWLAHGQRAQSQRLTSIRP
jgi:hypothetical protein